MLTKMKHICYISLMFCAFITSCSRGILPEVSPAPVVPAVFPDDWLGYWQGSLEIYNHEGLAQKIPMAMDHQLTDTTDVYLWALIYGEDLIKGRRNYFLKVIDAEKGHYQVDEKNSILLNSYLIDNRLVSTFEVMDNVITSVYRLEGQKMYFEIYANNAKDALVTGATIQDGEDIPEVESYKTTGYQRGILTRVTGGQKNTLSN